MSNFKDYPDLSIKFDFKTKSGSQPGSLTVCQLPLFMIEMKNESDQTLKVDGKDDGGGDEVIIAIEDDTGETIDARRKEEMMIRGAGLESLSASFQKSGVVDVPAALQYLVAQAKELVERTPVLTGRYNILPGRKRSFLACFRYVPSDIATTEQIEGWFKTRKSLAFGLYDLPVQRDESGHVMKKTNFQFTFEVARWKDHYDYEDGRPVLKNSERLP